MIPDYLAVPADELGRNSPVRVRVKGDMASIAEDLAESMLAEILQGEESGKGATLIIPVGPVDHFPILAQMLNEQKISCRNTVFINMDEYLTNDDRWVPTEHPLSFRGYMDRAFYQLLDPALAPPPENRVFPDPKKPEAIPQLIASRSGSSKVGYLS